MFKQFFAALAASAALTAGAGTTSIQLGNYSLKANYALDALGGIGLEASGVTYARDSGTLFFVGDEGLGVVQVSTTGQTLSSMAFSAWPSASDNHDAEGIAYLGNGQFVVVEERLQSAYRFGYLAGGSVDLATVDWVNFGAPAGNKGTEGISVDPRDGSFVAVKEANPEAILAGTLSFAAGGGVSTMTALFDPTLLGVSSLSDVQTLAGVDALAGTAAADNLLVLSLGSRRLLEVTRTGQILSSLDLTSFTSQAIEGVTVDQNGVIYLVAEDSGTGNSRLLVLSSPVPEPAAWALLLAGMGVVLGRSKARARQS
ncbi:MAG TPA: SdiA-regulated domain-containing protein [Burkholderiaceae bacterium]